MLDASFLSTLKRKYLVTPKDEFLISKFSQKIMRIKKAYQTTITEELMKSSWEATRFKLSIHYGIVKEFIFKEEFKAKLRAEVEHKENNELI